MPDGVNSEAMEPGLAEMPMWVETWGPAPYPSGLTAAEGGAMGPWIALACVANSWWLVWPPPVTCPGLQLGGRSTPGVEGACGQDKALGWLDTATCPPASVLQPKCHPEPWGDPAKACCHCGGHSDCPQGYTEHHHTVSHTLPHSTGLQDGLRAMHSAREAPGRCPPCTQTLPPPKSWDPQIP